MRYVLLLLASMFFFPAALPAGDWPQFLGPQRNGVSDETGLLNQWPQGGPKVVWRVPGGVGMAGVSVSRGRAITMLQRDGQQRMIAFDVQTGKTLWDTPLAPEYKNQMGDGPRSTPTIAGDQVFVLTGEGILAAVSFADGKLLWSVPALKEHRGEIADYGMACSPLVVKDQVIVSLGAPNAGVAAFAAATGKSLWGTGGDPAGYSSPNLLKIGGKEQIVAFTGGSAVGLAVGTGEQLWRYSYVTDFGCNIAGPVVYKDQLFISSGENHGCALLALKPQGAGFEVQEVWTSLGPKSVMRNEWQTSLLVDDFLIGFDNVGGAGPVSHLACIHAGTGKAVWQKTRFGKGNAILADGKLFMTTLVGEVVIGQVSPTGFTELGRGEYLGKTRQAPALANGKLFVRDDKDVVCLDVGK